CTPTPPKRLAGRALLASIRHFQDGASWYLMPGLHARMRSARTVDVTVTPPAPFNWWRRRLYCNKTHYAGFSFIGAVQDAWRRSPAKGPPRTRGQTLASLSLARIFARTAIEGEVLVPRDQPKPLDQAPKETTRRSGPSQGYREERYMYVSM